MIKILIINFVIVIVILSLSGCRTSYTYYNYGIKNSKEELSIFRDYIGDRIRYLDMSEKNKDRTIETIYLTARPITGEYMRNTKIEILSDKIKIINEGKEYWINVNERRYGVHPQKEGINIRGDFTIYYGKVRITNKTRKDIDGKIIEMPPLTYSPYLEKGTYNPTLDAFNMGARVKESYSGFLENYNKK